MYPADHITRVRRLYKLILRLHRALPGELQILGDNYAREEFKRHKKCNRQEANIFLQEWADYALNLSKQLKPLPQGKTRKIGENLGKGFLDHLTDDQLLNLHELHKAALEKEEDNYEIIHEDKK